MGKTGWEPKFRRDDNYSIRLLEEDADNVISGESPIINGLSLNLTQSRSKPRECTSKRIVAGLLRGLQKYSRRERMDFQRSEGGFPFFSTLPRVSDLRSCGN